VSGPAWMILASAGFATMGLLVKVLGAEVPPAEMVAWRSAISGVLVLAIASRTGARLRPVNVRMHLVRGVVGVGSMICYFTAIARLPLGDAVLVTYASPLLVALLSPWTVGERPTRRTWAALLVGLSGVAMVVAPTGAEDPVGVACAVAASVFAACAYLSVRVLTRTDGTVAIVFWFSVVASALASASFLDGMHPLRPLAVLDLLAVGALGVVAQGALTNAYAVAEAAQVSVFAYATPVFAYALSLAVLGEVPPATSLVGAALVLVAGGVVARAPVAAP
jgi:drug/metabolite transporter (DMT)-like permease